MATRHLRLSDVSEENLRRLPPISGFQHLPILSLEKAVVPLESIVPEVERMVYIVKKNCKNPEEDLTPDESASIMLYSMEWSSTEESFYLMLNKTLRSVNRQDLKPWFLYLRLFIHALSKLPSKQGQTIYRGTKVDLSAKYPIGRTFVWWAFSSCTTSIEVLENEQFFGKTGTRTLFVIETDTGKNIRQHSMFSYEVEVLLIAATNLTVVSKFNVGNGLHIVCLKETQSPFPLLEPPLPGSTAFEIFPVETNRNDRLIEQINTFAFYSRINLSAQDLTDDDMLIVAEKAITEKKCVELNLENNRITAQGVSNIVGSLRRNHTLESLMLYNTRIGDVGIDFLCQAIQDGASALQTLELGSTGMTDRGANSLAKLLERNQSLVWLGLGANRITDRGCQSLIEACMQNQTRLQRLYLHENPGITDASIDILLELFKTSFIRLNDLDLSGCNLSDNSKQTLRTAVASKENFRLTL